MDIILNNTSDEPIYQQIYSAIRTQILNLTIPKDQPLPPIRTIAKELRVSVITIKKAWEALERDGFIYSVVGRGCFVADLSESELSEKRLHILETKIKEDIIFYKSIGVSEDMLIEMLRKYY